MPYIHFTEAQKLRANAVDLVEFLRFKGEPLIREGSEFRMASNHSVTVRGSEWYDHATEKGGGPVTFLKEFYGMNYQETVLTLLNEDAGQFCPQVAAPREKAKKEFVLPPANENNRRVFAYLLKHRHLDRDVLTTFVRSGLIYEDQKYHNAVFVGRDQDGTPRHAHKRSTNSQGKTFRMTAEGSDFRYAFNWPGTSGHLLVFEAPIDMLSLISLYHDSDWAKHSYPALKNVLMSNAAMAARSGTTPPSITSLPTTSTLTDFLETIKERCQFSKWFCGHYHVNQVIDERFVIQWEQISKIDCN